MEMYVFLRMGKTDSDVQVVALVDDDKDGKNSADQLRRNFANFRTSNAQCFKPEDRERLLAVVEAGFGNFRTFDSLVRRMLKNDTHSTFEAVSHKRLFEVQNASMLGRNPTDGALKEVSHISELSQAVDAV